MGNFISTLVGLTPNTTYYVRAYATNSEGTVYGEEASFFTSNGDDGLPNTCAVGTTLSDNNTTGFSALPACSYNGSYCYYRNVAYFWSTSKFEYNNSATYGRELYYDNAIVTRTSFELYCVFSVRCVKD